MCIYCHAVGGHERLKWRLICCILVLVSRKGRVRDSRRMWQRNICFAGTIPSFNNIRPIGKLLPLLWDASTRDLEKPSSTLDNILFLNMGTLLKWFPTRWNWVLKLRISIYIRASKVGVSSAKIWSDFISSIVTTADLISTYRNHTLSYILNSPATVVGSSVWSQEK